MMVNGKCTGQKLLLGSFESVLLKIYLEFESEINALANKSTSNIIQ